MATTNITFCRKQQQYLQTDYKYDRMIDSQLATHDREFQDGAYHIQSFRSFTDRLATSRGAHAPETRDHLTGDYFCNTVRFFISPCINN